MKLNYLLLAICVVSGPIASLAQEQTSNGYTEAPLLTVQEAISLALENNRLVKNSVLEEEKYDFRVSTMRSRRLPQFKIDVLGGSLLQPFDFTFDQGVFGTYPGVGLLLSHFAASYHWGCRDSFISNLRKSMNSFAEKRSRT